MWSWFFGTRWLLLKSMTGSQVETERKDRLRLNVGEILSEIRGDIPSNVLLIFLGKQIYLLQMPKTNTVTIQCHNCTVESFVHYGHKKPTK